MSIEFIQSRMLGSIYSVHSGPESCCVVWSYWAPKPVQVRSLSHMLHFLQGLFSSGSGSCYSNPVTCNSDHSLQQFKGVSITVSISAPTLWTPALASAPVWTYPRSSSLGVDLLQCGPTHGPQSLQGSADVALYTATVTWRCTCSSTALSKGHSLSRGVPAVL